MVDPSHPTRGASRLFDLPRPVWLLGWVSLATDSATEAIYPLLPFFLTRVLGAGAVSLGVLEGAAEAVNSILKIVSGRIADRSPRKRPLVLFGYSLSSIARPFIADDEHLRPGRRPRARSHRQRCARRAAGRD